MPPVVGITAYAEQARWGEAWDLPATLLPRHYVDSVAATGAVPLLLPPVAGITGALDRLDGLLLAGGGDIDPGRYGAPTGTHTAGVQAGRDTAEVDLLAGALARGLPVLGVCRGMQLLNVCRGGTLNQHVPDVVGHTGHRQRTGIFDTHPVTVAEHSRTARVLGRTMLDVPTYHHQSVAALGRNVSATAWAEDGTVEAIEYTDVFNVLGVQWHPEMGTDPALFTWLTERAGEGATEH
ncbi:gamma-glutamyl-gamma-aminobutyrate hydrolase family protein [Nocardiopsis exhalans]|uniref:Gamma-glutamyl-gamma-aminobutyrate hydrolase family protein n=1 Tax=Nocardiopsis exhalans TaxID=163604 RepID=A0ABY5DED8_9ACTN|nr:gamma-glutamyl-gamma-aminobutyrate hydrolase family protein [Nocardiopsis exhalans]USY22305.1 gamma-glutamyl-gamma-aminobutyrate hydrolase family protein [Nocardiopsis exhalans]